MTTTTPVLAPAYPMQWTCHESEGLEVAYVADEAAVREAIAGKPFGFVQPWVIFYGGRMIRHDLGLTNAWNFSMLSVPVRFRGETALWSLFMFVDDVPAILAGRELLGEPKKWGDMTWHRQPGECGFELGLLGETLGHASARIGDGLPGSAVAERLGLGAGTRLLNHRILVSPCGTEPAVEQIVAVGLKPTFRYRRAEPSRFAFDRPRDQRLDELLAPLHRFAPARVLAANFREGGFVNGVGPHCEVFPFIAVQEGRP